MQLLYVEVFYHKILNHILIRLHREQSMVDIDYQSRQMALLIDCVCIAAYQVRVNACHNNILNNWKVKWNLPLLSQ